MCLPCGLVLGSLEFGVALLKTSLGKARVVCRHVMRMLLILPLLALLDLKLEKIPHLGLVVLRENLLQREVHVLGGVCAVVCRRRQLSD